MFTPATKTTVRLCVAVVLGTLLVILLLTPLHGARVLRVAFLVFEDARATVVHIAPPERVDEPHEDSFAIPAAQRDGKKGLGHGAYSVVHAGRVRGSVAVRAIKFIEQLYHRSVAAGSDSAEKTCLLYTSPSPRDS